MRQGSGPAMPPHISGMLWPVRGVMAGVCRQAGATPAGTLHALRRVTHWARLGLCCLRHRLTHAPHLI